MAKVIESMANNQVVIEHEGKTIFQSYDSVIAIIGEGKISLSHHYDYSRTTMKYLKQFLGHGIKETRERIESGEYKLDIDTDGNRLHND